MTLLQKWPLSYHRLRAVLLPPVGSSQLYSTYVYTYCVHASFLPMGFQHGDPYGYALLSWSFDSAFVESAAIDSLLYHIWCTVCSYLLHTCTPDQPLGRGLFRKYVPHSKIFNSLSLSCSALKGCRVDQSLGAGAMKWLGMPTSDDSLAHMVLCGKTLNTNWCQNPFLLNHEIISLRTNPKCLCRAHPR